MFQDPADVKQSQLTQACILVTGKERFAIFPERRVSVHTGTVVAKERFRHEGHYLVVLLGNVLQDVFVVHHHVAHGPKRRKTDVDFCLTGGRDFMMLPFNRNAGFFQFQTHLISEILESIGRRHREIPFLVTDLVPEIRKLLAPGVPDRFATIDAVK